MPNFDEITKQLIDLLTLVFGNHVPDPVKVALGYVILLGLLVWAVSQLMNVVASTVDVWQTKIRPLWYSAEAQARVHKRRLFAEHIESELKRIDRLEDWKDRRFAELEAEVEAEGPRQGFVNRVFEATRSGLRTEKSLSGALAGSRAKVVLVEGEPGSGKSVALRHVAMKFAARGKSLRNVNSLLPIYVNLKELDRNPEEPIDSHLIRNFIHRTLNRPNDRDIDDYLEVEFQRGLQAGSWVFLFDSFDELPEILSATEADAAISEYRDAIDSFLHTMNLCRGIVASRKFRAPKQHDWPTFVITPLSENRQKELIKRFGLPVDRQKTLLSGLRSQTGDISTLRRNPLFLSLLCEHVRVTGEFPESIHGAFESYVNSRLERDSDRVQARYHVVSETVRSFAESVAFCMAADPRLGLSPSRERLKESLHRYYAEEFDAPVDILLDALEYVKLARPETATGRPDSKSFTFSHRRFQEYFATAVVIRNPDRVSAADLLTDGRWRETAVVMCQATDSPDKLLPIFNEARLLLAAYLERIESIEKGDSGFDWPPGCWHTLDLLQTGFARRLSVVPLDVRMLAGQIVSAAAAAGTIGSLKDALEVAGLADEPTMERLLLKGFESRSHWVREVAYRQAARLSVLSARVTAGVRATLIDLAKSGQLRRDKEANEAYVRRLAVPSGGMVDTLNLLLGIQKWDLLAHLVALGFLEFLLRDQRLSTFNLEWLPLSFALSAAVVPIVNMAGFGQNYATVAWLRFMILESNVLTIAPHLAQFNWSFEYVLTVIKAMPILLIYGCLVAFYPTALAAARQGAMTRTWQRPLLFVAPIVFAVQQIGQRKSWMRKALLYVAIWVATVAGGFALIGFWESYVNPRLPWLTQFVVWGFVALMALVWIVFIGIAARRGLRWLADKRRWRRLLNQPRPPSAKLAWEAVQVFEMRQSQAAFIAMMREKRWLEPTVANIEYLKELGNYLEGASHEMVVVDQVWRLLDDLRKM